MTKVGDTIKAKGRKTLRVTGADAGAWIASPVNDFAAPIRLTPDDMTAYGVQPPSNVDPDTALAEAFNRQQREASEAYRRANPPSRPSKVRLPGLTPEEQIDLSREHDESAAAEVARRIAGDEVAVKQLREGHVSCAPAVALELRKLGVID